MARSVPAGLTRLRSVLRRPASSPVFSGNLQPEPARPAYIVGDLHGCLDLLNRMLDCIGEDRGAQNFETADLVFVGDYIDRGPESAAVLERLRSLQTDMPDHMHCLRGNHETMCLDFLKAPQQAGPVWFRNGGRDTLLSFGIAVPTRLQDDAALVALADAARAALPPDLLDWIAERPLTWQSGDVVAVHAALDPALPVADQAEDTCLWGHARFPGTPRADGLWVVHGHRITVPPVAENGQISVDTGGYARGELTCAALIPGEDPRFLCVGPN